MCLSAYTILGTQDQENSFLMAHVLSKIKENTAMFSCRLVMNSCIAVVVKSANTRREASYSSAICLRIRATSLSAMSSPFPLVSVCLSVL